MKRSYYFYAAAVLLVGFFVWYQLYYSPFVWKPDFKTDSKQPFGMAFFDRLLKEKMPMGYEVVPQVPDTLDPKRDAVLYCKYDIGTYPMQSNIYEQELERANKLRKFADQGGKVIVASCRLLKGNKIYETYKLGNLESDANPHWWLGSCVDDMKDEFKPRETVITVGTGKRYRLQPFLTVTPALGNNMEKHHIPLLKKHVSGEMLAFRGKFNNGGSIDFVSAPLLFSNYAIFDEDARQVTSLLLEPVSNRHLIRVEGINDPYQPVGTKRTWKNIGSLSFVRQHAPLRYAYYLAVVTVVLFFVFNSRRRMRAIPLLPEPNNATLEFARFMGTFHLRRGDFAELCVQMFDEVISLLNEAYALDVSKLEDAALCDVIENRTRLPRNQVMKVIIAVSRLRSGQSTIGQKEAIGLMDEIKAIRDAMV